jgi:hypothetical protein
VSAHLEPADLGLKECAGCGKPFTSGQHYYRGAAITCVGLLAFILCMPCRREVERDAKASEKLNIELGRLAVDAALRAMPAGGNA